MTAKQSGQEGFSFWWGTVEDREDPLQLGRCRIRIHNLHSSDKTILPTEDLHWSPIVMPSTSSSSAEVGRSPTGIALGATVFGFFADGDEGQMPIVLGTTHGIPEVELQAGGERKQVHDVAQLARGRQNIVKELVPDVEPASPYKAKYPYNKVTTTEGKHAIEIDDTPGAERLHVFHTKGSYVEIHPDGTIVVKSVANKFDITVKDSTTYVGGNATVIILGDAGIGVRGNAQVNCEKNLTANTQGITTIYSKGDVVVNSDSNIAVHSKGDTSIVADGNLALKGTRIDFNEG